MKNKAWQQLQSNYVPGVGLRAAGITSIHPDIWARDAFISCYFLLNSSFMHSSENRLIVKKITQESLNTFLGFIQDGRIPLRIENATYTHEKAILRNIFNANPVFKKITKSFVCPPMWTVSRARYKSAQPFAGYPVDSLLWLTVTFFEYEAAFKDMPDNSFQKINDLLTNLYSKGIVKNGLIYEGQLANWMDSLRYNNVAVSYTNILFLKCLQLLSKTSDVWGMRYKETQQALSKLKSGMFFYYGITDHKKIDAYPVDAMLLNMLWFQDVATINDSMQYLQNAKVFEIPVRPFVKLSWDLRLHGITNIPNVYHLSYSWPWLTGLALLVCLKSANHEYYKLLSHKLITICELNGGFPEVVNQKGFLINLGGFKMANDISWTAAAVTLT